MLCCRLVACEICRVLFLVDAVSAFLVLVMLGSLIFLQFTNGYHILFIMIHHHNVGCKILLIVCYIFPPGRLVVVVLAVLHIQILIIICGRQI